MTGQEICDIVNKYNGKIVDIGKFPSKIRPLGSHSLACRLLQSFTSEIAAKFMYLVCAKLSLVGVTSIKEFCEKQDVELEISAFETEIQTGGITASPFYVQEGEVKHETV